jgi:hypothetical protein
MGFSTKQILFRRIHKPYINFFNLDAFALRYIYLFLLSVARGGHSFRQEHLTGSGKWRVENDCDM